MTDNDQSYGGRPTQSTMGNEQQGSDRNPNASLRGDNNELQQQMGQGSQQDGRNQGGQQQGQQNGGYTGGQADYGSAGQQEGQQQQRGMESDGQQNGMSGSTQGGEVGTGGGGDGEQYGSGIVDAGFGNGSPSMQSSDENLDGMDDEDDLSGETGASAGGAM